MNEHFDIRIEWDARQVRAALHALDAKNYRFAIASALTATATAVRDAERAGMVSAFDRPRTWTLNSLQVQRATRDQLSAVVGFKDGSRQGGLPAWRYLQAEVFGGQRGHVGLESVLSQRGLLSPGGWLVPASGAKLDAFGNVPRSTYSAVIAGLQARGAGRGRASTKRYFYGNPGGRGRGVWQAQGRTVRPMFLEASSLSYSPRFGFYEIAGRTAARVFPSAFEASLTKTLGSMR